MVPQIIVLRMHHFRQNPKKVGLRYVVLEAGVCFGVFNGMKEQMIQRKTIIRGIEVSLSYYQYCFYLSSDNKN